METEAKRGKVGVTLCPSLPGTVLLCVCGSGIIIIIVFYPHSRTCLLILEREMWAERQGGRDICVREKH